MKQKLHSIYMPDKLWGEVQREAEIEEMPVSMWMRRAIRKEIIRRRRVRFKLQHLGIPKAKDLEDPDFPEDE